MKIKIKKILRIFLKSILIFIGLILLYCIMAFCLSRITVDGEAKSTEDVSIYIKTNGMHTDIVVPTKNNLMDWSKEIKYENAKLVDSTFQYLAMGWGDKGFYLQTPSWSDLKFTVAFKAAFALSTTAIHATYYNAIAENDSCRKIMISNRQYKRLIDYICTSLQKDKDGHFINIKTNANYGDTDAFYEAKGSYSMFHTCNTWANNALKKCGQKACLWTAFDTGIFLKYRK